MTIDYEYKGGFKMTKSLYTAKDIKDVRDMFIINQKGIDPILDEPFKETIVCDHDHSTQHCRAALNRNTNAFEGLVNNAYVRCIKWLTDKSLPDILRNLADYLEQDFSQNPYHSGWIKSVKVQFNKLNAAQQNEVIKSFGLTPASNLKSRKEIFSRIVLDRQYGYDVIKNILTREFSKSTISSAINSTKG